ncbi:hypothetical protein [Pseudoalteromonas sp.]|uniref:hypothetical protein n=1 Tax=Pseudoalteromonas sp. TaxID=53249 RepID=UPI0035649D38
MKKIYIAFFVLLSTLVGTGCNSTTLSNTVTEAERNNLEKIYSFDVTSEKLLFVVKSTGCTSKEDFELLYQVHQGKYEFALKRLKPDMCRAMPRAYPVSFKLPAIGVSIDNIIVLNPIDTNTPAKRSKIGY